MSNETSDPKHDQQAASHAAEPVENALDADAPKGVSRRAVLTTVGVAAGVAAVGGGGWWYWKQQNKLQVTQSWADRELALTSPSGVCEAPLIIAYEKGFFSDAGLNVSLKKTGDGEDTTAAVGSGKYVASNGIFFNYLGPIYNGTPVKLSGGLHHGCLDLYVRNDDSISQVADLKGKKIGVSKLQGSAVNFFSLDLLDVGINSSPEAKQVEWVQIEQALLPKALEDGTVDAIATSGGFLPIIEAVDAGTAKELSSNNIADGLSNNADAPCCAVVLNSDFVSQDPVTAKKLVEAWSEGSRWAGNNLEETAQIEADGNYISGTAEEALAVLKTLTFDPSPKNLREQLEPGIEKYKQTGFLNSDVDPSVLADKVFVDLDFDY